MNNIVLRVDNDCKGKKDILKNINRYSNKLNENIDFKKNRNFVRIKDFISKSIVNADPIMKRKFPISKNDIFISHSHKDIDMIRSIAKLLKNGFGYNCFIDSDVWWNYNDVIKEVLDEIKRRGIYEINDDSIGIENIIRDNIDIMLTSSLMNVMNNSKIILLFDTENYIEYLDGEEFTYSTWIYHELCCSQYIDINNQQYKPYGRHVSLNESVKFKYLVDYCFDSIRLSCLFDWFKFIKQNNIKDPFQDDSVKILYNKFIM